MTKEAAPRMPMPCQRRVAIEAGTTVTPDLYAHLAVSFALLAVADGADPQHLRATAAAPTATEDGHITIDWIEWA